MDCGTRYEPTSPSSVCPTCAARAPLAIGRAPVKVDAAIVEARDRAVLAALNRNGGLAMIRTLRKALPPGDPATTPAAVDDAVKNALLRLKAKGQVERTGDTWSIVGIATAPGAPA
jgi:hypothetical protein